jgi:uncharacterized protein YbjT (DUF2867 family)
MIVAIVGATGVVGRNLIPRLIEAGHTVRAGVRWIGSAPPFPEVTQVEIDILERATLERLVEGSDTAINVASSIRGRTARAAIGESTTRSGALARRT